MFEGKHIHFSPIDQKPLCSFSSKICRQRRLNGFAFCIRHILEDPSAPFQVCTFVAPPGQNKCTNVISMAHPQGLCNTHLQLAGFPVAKRDRRNAPRKDNMANLPMTSSPNGKTGTQSNEPTSSSMDTSDGDPFTFSDDMEAVHHSESNHCPEQKKVMELNGSHHDSPMAVEPLTPSSTSSSSVDGNTDLNLCKKSIPLVPIVHNGLKIKPPRPPEVKPKLSSASSKKKKQQVSPFKALEAFRLPVVLRQLGDVIRGNEAQYLLPKGVDKEEEAPLFLAGLSRFLSINPLRSSASGTPRAQRLAKIQKEYRHRYLQLSRMIETEETCRGERQASATTKLVEAARRYPNETGLLLQGRSPFTSSSAPNSNMKIFSRKRCSFRRTTGQGDASDSGCAEFSLPCSTLCSRHILYSVDQQLFEFCSARGAGPTPCGAPVLAIHSGLPYCPAHLEQAERAGSTAGAVASYGSDPASNYEGMSRQLSLDNSGVNGKSANRKKSRSRSTSSLGRHSRRLRNRRRAKRIGGGGGSETRIHCIEPADNGMELDVETVDSPENCSPAYPTPAQLISHAAHSVNHAPMVPTAVDHEVEILEDHDLKELLNRLPDEAFQEIFAMTQAAASSTRNGGGLFVPSQEEAEELERALAVEGVPMPIMDKYATMSGVVGHAGESDLGDLSLIDDHALALAHDLMTLGGGAAAQNLLMANPDPNPVSSSSAYMDNLNTSHPPLIHPGYSTEVSTSSSPMLSKRKSVSMTIPAGQQASPARGSSPPSLSHHHHNNRDGTLIEDGAAQAM